MRPVSLPIRLLSSFFFVGATALCTAGLLCYWTLSGAAREHAATELERRARLTGFAVADAIAANALDDVQAMCATIGRDTPYHVSIVLPDGTVVGDSEDRADNVDNQANRPEIAAALSEGEGRSTRFDPVTRSRMQYFAAPIESGSAIVRVGMPASESALKAANLLLAVGAGLAVIVLVGALASRWIARYVASGVSAIQRDAENSMRQDGDSTNVDPRPAELSALNESVASMIAHLKATARDADRQRYQQQIVLSSMVECVLAVDSHERIITLNQAAADLFGIHPGESNGRPVYEVLRNPDVEQLIIDTLSQGRSIQREFAIHAPDARIVQAQAAVLRSHGETDPGVVVVLHDITRLRRLEEARREFVANVSHELRTPITSITGFVETLLDGAIFEPDQARAFLRIIMRQTDRLNAIIDDLLTLSKLEQGSLAESGLLTMGNLEQVLKNAVRACNGEAAAKGVHVAIQGDKCGLVPMHEELMEQAVTNLIQNAIRYSEPGDLVAVRCRRDHDRVAITVEDEGCGIEPRHLPRLFERFYRVDRARSREVGGTGLGLAIVKHIAQAHGGTVEVRSKVGEGSLFTIRIPWTGSAVEVSNEAIETVQ